MNVFIELYKRNINNTIGVVMFFVLLSQNVFSQVSKNTTQTPPNIIFILVDDMGWMDLGCYGSTFYESPNIDKLASQGMRFTNAYVAAPVCAPSRASIMSGKNPARPALTTWHNGKGKYNKSKPWQKLKTQKIDYFLYKKEDNLAKSLKAQGYQTYFAGKWHLGKTEDMWPENQGFDINKGGWAAGSPRAAWYTNEETGEQYWQSEYFVPYHNPRLKDGPRGENLTDRLTNETIAFLKDKKDDPFFIYLSYYSVHNPLDPKQNYLEKFQEKARRIGLDSIQPFVDHKKWMTPNPTNDSWKERLVQSDPKYAAMIYNLDINIGKLMHYLKILDLEKNTIVVLTSDNGGLSTQEGSVTSNLPLRGGKGWLYEGGIREPLIIRWPNVVKPESISEELITGTDYYPTFLEIAGGQPNDSKDFDGKSFLPYLKNKTTHTRDTLFWHSPHYYRKGSRPASAIRVKNYKLIKNYEDNRLELYDLKNDISEMNNLRDSLPTKALQMKRALESLLHTRNALIPELNPDYNHSYDTKNN